MKFEDTKYFYEKGYEKGFVDGIEHEQNNKTYFIDNGFEWFLAGMLVGGFAVILGEWLKVIL